MNEELKNSIKTSFIKEPSVDFTSAVMQRIETKKNAEYSANEPLGLWVYIVLFCILGAPICLITGYVIFQNFTFDISEVTLPSFEFTHQGNIRQFFIDVLPYSLFLLVFFSLAFLSKLGKLNRSIFGRE